MTGVQTCALPISAGGESGLSDSDRESVRTLLSRRGGGTEDERADSGARQRAIRARLAGIACADDDGSADQGGIDRLADVFSDIGVLEPDAEAIGAVRRASPAALAEVRESAMRMDALEAAASAIDRMGGIIRALRIYAHRDQTREATVVSLPFQLDSALTLFSDSIYEGGVRVVADYARLPRYCCFADQLQQVWMHVIGNAVEAMGQSGILTIRGRFESGSVRVDISDTGPGIPPEHLEEVFEPFFTTKTDGSGTGLGLSIAREIVSTHRGTLSFETGPAGTTFTVLLPAAGVVEAEPAAGGEDAVDA